VTNARPSITMKTIHKYPLKVAGQQTVEMPADAQILSVQMQGQKLCIWALVTPTLPMVDRKIEVFGTGKPVSELPMAGRNFLGTVQTAGGALVWHVFEKIERRL